MPNNCIHCGQPATRWSYLRDNTGAYECPIVRGGVPACVEGQAWYGEKTIDDNGVRRLKVERENNDDG